MTITCPACGFENRDKARFCLGCAQPIKAAVSTAADLAARRERASAVRKRRRRRKMPSPNRTRNIRIFIAVGVLATAVLIGGLVSLLQRNAPVTALAVTPATTKPAPLAETPPAQSAADAPQEGETNASEAAPVDAVERLRLSVEQIEREDRARALAREQQLRAVAAQHRHTDDAKAPAPSTPGETVNTQAGSGTGSATGQKATAPATAPTGNTPAPLATASAATSVDQLCANAGNMLMRDLCRIRECAKPAHAQDGVCVRFRKMDDERKAQDEYR